MLNLNPKSNIQEHIFYIQELAKPKIQAKAQKFINFAAGFTIDLEDELHNLQYELRLILAHILNKNLSYIRLNQDLILSAQELTKFNKLASRKLQDEPLSSIVGYTIFYGYKFKVSKDTLHPRNDTEQLVNKSLEHIQYLVEKEKLTELNILDLGTGTSCLLASVALEALKQFQGVKLNLFAVDINDNIISLAKKNLQELGLIAHTQVKVQLFVGNWYSPFLDDKKFTNFFNLILSNPPYIVDDLATRELYLNELEKYEPSSALIASDNGLADIKIIVQESQKYLAKQGLLMIEHGYDQSEQVKEIFFQQGYKVVQNLLDYNKNIRATYSLVN